MLNAVPKLVGDGAARSRDRHGILLGQTGHFLGLVGGGTRGIRDCRRTVCDCRGNHGETRDRASHLRGTFGIAVGLIVFLYPDQAGTAIVLVIGIWAAVTGIVEIVSRFGSAVRSRMSGYWDWAEYCRSFSG